MDLEKVYKVDKWKYFDLIDYSPHPRQRLFHESTARFKIPVCGRRFGKALDIDTLIPTPYGMIRMKDLQVGDQVFDENGKICNITFVSEIWKEDSFELLFDDESVLVAHGGHEWLTYDKKARKSREAKTALHESDRRRKIVPPAVRTTNSIAETLMYGNEPNHAIQLTKPVEFSKQELPIDPYLLGVWLGDGTTSDGNICIANQDEWIIDKLISRGHETYTTKSLQGCKLWRILGLRTLLKENFLRGNKHVPQEYLYGSIEQRRDLLNGLMDTDGSVANNHVDFDNTNKNLADVVDYLIKSLGGKVSRSQRIGRLYGVDKKMCYRVHTGGLVDVFSLPRKLLAQRKLPKRKHYYRFIKMIKPVGIRQVKCIQVDSPSSLYLAGASFIPTHNTYMGARELEPVLMTPNKRVWICGPTYDLGEKEFRIIWHDMIIKLGLGREKEVKRNYSKKQGDLSIQFPWHTRLEVRSADRPENLVGEGLDYVIMSEAAKHTEDTWSRFIRPALTDRRGSATFSTTPEGQNWVYKLWKMGRDPHEPDYASWQFPSWDNPHLYPGGRYDPEILLTERTTPDEIFKQEYGADFTSFSGKVYNEFDEQTHVTNVPFIPNLPNYICADEETEILTIDGWKKHYELKPGNQVLSIDPDGEYSEWDEVLTVNRYQGEHDVIRMEGRSHSSVTTPNHNWLVNRSYVRKSGGELGWRWTTTENLTQDDRIPTSSPCLNLPTEPKYMDSFVELIAWLWTEGSISRNGTFSIHQSHKVNRSNVDRIRVALTSYCIDKTFWTENVWASNPNITTFTIGKELSNELWAALLDHKMVDPKFISNLTKAQLQLFVDVSILGDGHQRGNKRTICQKNARQLNAVQMACSLLGLTTNLTKSNGYTLHINNRTFVNPGMAVRHKDGKFVIKREKYKGVVWCPMTKNGTWLARRRGTVYFTGNCFDWGFAAPMAAIEFQIDSMQRVRVWREHYKSRMRLKDYLEEMKQRKQPDGYHLDLCFGDAADPEAVVSVSQDFFPCYADPRSKSGTSGASIESGKREGIELVKGFLKTQEVSEDEFGTPIEEPWLIIDHSCINLINEFNNYRIAEAVRGKDPREDTYKRDDHALDALRYGLMHIFKLGATSSLADFVDSGSMHDLPDTGYFTSNVRFA